MTSALIDTNVLVYTVDRTEQVKREIATALAKRTSIEGSGVVSTQTIGEFYRVAMRAIPDPLTAEEANRAAVRWAAAWPVLGIDRDTMLEALRGTQRYRLPYRDAQLWATARLNHVPVILSEDFADGSDLEGVRFANPFADGFDLDAVLRGE